MSTDPRLCLDADLAPGAVIELDKDQAHYLVSVMRRDAGDGVRVFNGRDGEWSARVSEAGRRRAVLTVETQTRHQAATPDLDLCFAPVKKARTDFIVEKATELGARRIRPVMTRRTNAERVRTDRLQALAREAAEQTERLDLPQIAEPVSLVQLLNGLEPDRTLIFCDEGGEAAPILAALSGRPRGGAWAILIGPEGGFAPEERGLLRARPGVLAVTLGPRILRADTAAAAALSLFQAALGDW